MKLNTRHFGEIEIDDNEIIEFADGIPGFYECTKFVLLKDDETIEEGTKNMFSWLQSIDDTDICFVLMDAVLVFPDYDPLVEKSDMESLGEYNPEHFELLNIAKFPDNIKEATVNLKAPIVINHELKQGKQVICTNDNYFVRHNIFEQDNNEA